MHPGKKIPNLEQLAQQYAVSTRTVRRWHEQGADVSDPAAVAELVLRHRSPLKSTLKTLSQLLHP